jgi:hypothetical protein
MDSDPDPGGPKTYGSDGSGFRFGSGFGSGSATLISTKALSFVCSADSGNKMHTATSTGTKKIMHRIKKMYKLGRRKVDHEYLLKPHLFCCCWSFLHPHPLANLGKASACHSKRIKAKKDVQ